MRVFGVDPGVECTGLAVVERDGSGATVVEWRAVRTTGDGFVRHAEARAALRRDLVRWRPDLAVLEGYGLGRQVGRAISMAELGGVMRMTLDLSGVPWAVVPPATLKRWATGDGTSDKDAMIAAAGRVAATAGHDGPSDHNAADAVLLAAAGLAAVEGVDVIRGGDAVDEWVAPLRSHVTSTMHAWGRRCTPVAVHDRAARRIGAR